MPLARIRTNFPDEVEELCEALVEAGYVVETVRPEDFRIAPADLELTVDKLPAVEAWRRLPDADVVYVAPGTPESHDIRCRNERKRNSSAVARIGSRAQDASRWSARQWREVRARFHDLRQRWTPPREYHAPPHLEPSAPSSIKTVAIDAAIEKARLQLEERHRREEAEARELAAQANLAAENRRRAREAAEARALLEEQQRIEAMVRASAELREKVVKVEVPVPREVPRRVPRHILRTRRDRAFLRAGVAAFSLSLGLAMLGGAALHPRPASSVMPRATAIASVPFAKSAQPAAIEPQTAAQKPPSVVPKFAQQAIASTATILTADSKPVHSKQNDFPDEVIVRKPAVARAHAPKGKDGVIHYSDLD